MSGIRIDNLKHNRHLTRYNYGDLRALKKAYRVIHKLEQRSIYSGDSASAIVLVDLMSAIEGNESVLTGKQSEAMKMVLIEDITESEAASMLGISQQALHYRIKAALLRIRKYLISGYIQPKPPSFSDEQNDGLKDLYGQGASDKEIAIILNLPVRRVQNKIRYWRKRGILGQRGYRV